MALLTNVIMIAIVGLALYYVLKYFHVFDEFLGGAVGGVGGFVAGSLEIGKELIRKKVDLLRGFGKRELDLRAEGKKALEKALQEEQGGQVTDEFYQKFGQSLQRRFSDASAMIEEIEHAEKELDKYEASLKSAAAEKGEMLGRVKKQEDSEEIRKQKENIQIWFNVRNTCVDDIKIIRKKAKGLKEGMLGMRGLYQKQAELLKGRNADAVRKMQNIDQEADKMLNEWFILFGGVEEGYRKFDRDNALLERLTASLR